MASFVHQRSYPRWKEPFNLKNESSRSIQQINLQKQMSLSKEYGSAIISRDLAKEDMYVTPSPIKIESDSEKTNLDDIKSLWGIKLRHVVVKDKSPSPNETDSFFDFGCSKNASELVSDSEGFVKNDLIKKMNRSVSLDYLGESNYYNNNNNNSNLNNDKSMSFNNKKKLEILSEVTKPETKTKHIRRTKSLLMQNISNQMFYQPVDTEKKHVLNLEELLIKDEKKLRGVVYNEQMNDIYKEKTDLINLSKQETRKSLSTEKTPENNALTKITNNIFDMENNNKLLNFNLNEQKSTEVSNYQISNQLPTKAPVSNQFATESPISHQFATSLNKVKNETPGVKILKKMSLQSSISYNPISIIKTDANIAPELKKQPVFNKTDASLSPELIKNTSLTKNHASTDQDIKKNTVSNKADASTNQELIKNTVLNKTDVSTDTGLKKNNVSNEDAYTAPDFNKIDGRESSELKKSIVFNKLGQVIVSDYDVKEPKVKNVVVKDVLKNEKLGSTKFSTGLKETINKKQSMIADKVNNNSFVPNNQLSSFNAHQEDDQKKINNLDDKIQFSPKINLQLEDKITPGIFYENNNIASTNFNSYSSLKIIDSKFSKSLETNVPKENHINAVIEHINNISKKENLNEKPYLAFDLNSNNRRISRLTIIPGVDRDAQLDYGKYQIGVKNLSGNKNIQNFKVLIFTLNNYDEEFSEEELLVPEIVFNGVVEQIKSILLTNKSSVQKKKVVFAVKDLETIYSYPSEDSYPIEDFYTDSDVDMLLAKESENDTSMLAIEGAIQHERERLIKTYYENQIKEEIPVKLSTEGNHYQMQSNLEDGGVMLF